MKASKKRYKRRERRNQKFIDSADLNNHPECERQEPTHIDLTTLSNMNNATDTNIEHKENGNNSADGKLKIVDKPKFINSAMDGRHYRRHQQQQPYQSNRYNFQYHRQRDEDVAYNRKFSPFLENNTLIDKDVCGTNTNTITNTSKLLKPKTGWEMIPSMTFTSRKSFSPECVVNGKERHVSRIIYIYMYIYII